MSAVTFVFKGNYDIQEDWTMYYSADIGVFGGSGLYELGEEYRRVDADTPYGKPSEAISLLDVNGVKVAFMPRP